LANRPRSMSWTTTGSLGAAVKADLLWRRDTT
jgi:hypothetical protein